jgi:hypothetical protein
VLDPDCLNQPTRSETFQHYSHNERIGLPKLFGVST